MRKEALTQNKGAQTYSEVYPIIVETLKKLKDNHSFLKTPAQSLEWKNKPKSVSKPGDSNQTLSGLLSTKRRPIGAMLDGRIAELYITTFASGNIDESLSYVKSIQDAIKQLDSRNPKGWIIVLTSNRGGNMWPMLAGLGSFLLPGIQGGFQSSDKSIEWWYYDDTKVGVGEDIILNFPETYQLKNRDLPIAVFTSERTASSAEGVIIALKNNSYVKVVGEATAGLTTANNNYKLKDGAELILTSAVFTSKEGRAFGSEIKPDIILSDKWYYCCGNGHAIMLSEVRKWIK